MRTRGCAVGLSPTKTIVATTFETFLPRSNSAHSQGSPCTATKWTRCKKEDEARRVQMLSNTVKVSNVTVWVFDSMVTD